MPLHFLLTKPDGALLDDPATSQPGDVVVLTGQEAHHAAAVRRVRVGEEVTVGDGRGTWLSGECESVSPREVVVRVLERDELPEPRPRVVLVQALAKGDRDELAVQAATELGVDVIIPWQAARSVSRWDPAKAQKGRARWSAIVREAGKQAHRSWLPEVSELVTTAELARRAAAAGSSAAEGGVSRSSRILVLEPTADTPLTAHTLTGDDRDIVLVVGPEGGIAAEEMAALTAAGAVPVRLGDTVLRTSTAGPAALAVVSAAIGRW